MDLAQRPEGRPGRYLTLAEREEIAVGVAKQETLRSIARRLGRAPSSVSREVARNQVKHRPGGYRAVNAQYKADQRVKRPKAGKLAKNQRLRTYVQGKLSGKGRWSPEQISHRIRTEFPDDEDMRISHETIYRALYVQGRGELRRELTRCLRTGRAVRKPRRRGETRGKRVIPPELMIANRPAEADDRDVPGHWEGDLILGVQNKSAVVTLVERSTRYVLLGHLPAGDHGGEAVRDTLLALIATLPAHLRRSLAWDQGSEMARHAEVTLATDLDIYFCDPHSPWQRGSNENTNGLLRQYLPKSTNLAVHTPADLADIAAGLNSRPRKTLNWATPAETLNKLLSANT
jgi:IS30 family transposase